MTETDRFFSLSLLGLFSFLYASLFSSSADLEERFLFSSTPLLENLVSDLFDAKRMNLGQPDGLC